MKLSNKSLGRDELALARERRRAETFGIRLGLSGEPCGDHERYRDLDEFRDHCDTPISYLKMVETGEPTRIVDHTRLEKGKDYCCIVQSVHPVEVVDLRWDFPGTCVICGEMAGRDFGAFADPCARCHTHEVCRRCMARVDQVPLIWERCEQTVEPATDALLCAMCMLDVGPPDDIPPDIIPAARIRIADGRWPRPVGIPVMIMSRELLCVL